MRPIGLFHVRSSDEIPARATLRVGDVLHVTAMGVIVKRNDDGAIELLGPLTTGTLAGSEGILPAGGPNAVLLVARRAGHAELEIVFGSWARSIKATMALRIEG